MRRPAWGVVQQEAALLATALSYRVVATMGDVLAAVGAWGLQAWGTGGMKA